MPNEAAIDAYLNYLRKQSIEPNEKSRLGDRENAMCQRLSPNDLRLFLEARRSERNSSSAEIMNSIQNTTLAQKLLNLAAMFLVLRIKY